MGFFKRWINIESVISIYNREGVEGVKNYLNSPDAIIITDDESESIYNVYRKGHSDSKLIKEIEKCISMEKE